MKLEPPTRSSRRPFCTVPILSHPELQLPFIVEVDASTTGVGAVLSQYHAETPRLHPCAYFSRKLSPAERNYDIGNFKLLAIKLALEEWRHWQEGAQHSFTVITDHKNLEYLRSAKRLKRLAGPFSSPGSSFPSCIDPEIRMSRRIPSHVFMPPTNPPHLNLFSLQSSLWAPSGGPWRNRSKVLVQIQILGWNRSIACISEPAPLGGPEGKI